MHPAMLTPMNLMSRPQLIMVREARIEMMHLCLSVYRGE